MLQLIGGGEVALDARRGRVTIVHFFATWCEPCRTEFPALAALARRMEGRPLEIVAVDVAEPESRVRAFLGSLPGGPPPFPIALDHDRNAMKTWGVVTLPSSFVLDGEGQPIWRSDGDIDWAAPPVAVPIERAIAQAEDMTNNDKPATGRKP